MKKPVTLVVQARMDASRLPNKMMLWLNGLPVIEWVYRRVTLAEKVDKVVFALPDTGVNDILAQHLSRIGATIFRGSQNDVLGRCCNAARAHAAGSVVRVCADNPFVSASEIDHLVDFFSENDYDYAYNHIPRNNRYPDGLGAEMVSFSILDCLEKQAQEPSHREHMFNYIWDNPESFRIGTFDPLDDALACPDLKLDLDTMEDYAWLLRLPVSSDMSARQIVAAAQSYPRKKDRK